MSRIVVQNTICCLTCLHDIADLFVLQGCTGTCEANRACVECRLFGTGELDKDQCSRTCKDYSLTPVDKLTPSKSPRWHFSRDSKATALFYSGVFTYLLVNCVAVHEKQSNKDQFVNIQPSWTQLVY